MFHPFQQKQVSGINGFCRKDLRCIRRCCVSRLSAARSDQDQADKEKCKKSAAHKNTPTSCILVFY